MSESTPIYTGDSDLDATARAIMALDEPQAPAGKQEQELPADEEVTGQEPVAEGQPEDGSETPDEPEEAESSDEEEPADAADDDGDKEPSISSIEDLAKALDVDPSEILSLKLKTKIDGEDGEASLADLVKSYQVEGHLTRKGQRLAEERQTFERTRQEAEAIIKQRTEQLDTQLALAQKRLLGEYSRIDWDALRTQNPSLYQQKYIEYQQLHGELAQAAQAIALEREQAQAAMAERHKEFLAEQKRLLANAVPEWNDRKVKDAELQEIREYLQARNIDPKELDLIQHHGYALVLRDAKNWQKLQADKKLVKKKIGDAPKIVRPGIRKSSSQLDGEKMKSLRERVNKSGKVDDLAAYILASTR